MGCLGCTSCGTSSGGSTKGCNSSGGCATGGCNRLNTYDWLSSLDIIDIDPLNIVEISFKNGVHKQFFRVADQVRVVTGDMVVAETGNGYDIGKVSLSGELVRLQMKRRRVDERSVNNFVLRRANERDLERLQEAREAEQPTMVRARAIARTLGLEMKIGDVEYQGDKRKATFYYTADGRVDFRELIRHFAKEFRVKIEMRQIGARQESALIGGIGSCGRELCCSTWLTDFKSVSTAAARYQNLAINQVKLSGQCGRLKCCLNYELDTYLDALSDFPSGADKLYTQKGSATLIKTDIFKKLLYYVYDHERGRGAIYPMDLSKVKEIQEMNARGEKPAEFDVAATTAFVPEEEGFVDVTGEIELPDDKKRRKKKKKKRPDQQRSGEGNAQTNNRGENRPKPQGGGGNGQNPGQGDRQGRPERPDRRPDPQQRGNNNPRPPKEEGANPQPPKGNNQGPRPNNPNNRSGGGGNNNNSGGNNSGGRPNPRPPQPPRGPQNQQGGGDQGNNNPNPPSNNDGGGNSEGGGQGNNNNRRNKNRNKRRR
ncbi:MAG: regulatory iron-sulfur-containing complex subunit RicT [Haliscomenobacter sp.]|uniref:regulatory iron-sulfur-containing complex subunit RicT n=1 Tax=Haliscomenobacter sp. TaxID=2717303 RepID=UPI0029B9EB72|nr:regulatory iron-sulfur-containing complex subunit RicT [Haliscomenobacter sp.]MDX2069579.1 regulatory iron-sulfur-containing complex subunit RicT [Haliscomenobacter sp.]